MVDFSVVGEILGETNMDYVGDSVADSMEEVGDTLNSVAGSAEVSEESLEDVSETLVGISAAAKNAESEIGDVGSEMQEIVGEAQAANASAATLAATLQALDAQDVGIDVDSDISEGFVESLAGRAGGFDRPGRMAVEEGIRQGIDDGGTLGDVARNVNRLTEESIGYEDIIKSLDDTLATNVATIGDLDDEYRSLRKSTDSVSDSLRELPKGLIKEDAFRESLARNLEFESEKYGKGSLFGALSSVKEEDRNVSELAQRISSMNSVSSDFVETMQAIERSFEPMGEGEAAPLPAIRKTPSRIRLPEDIIDESLARPQPAVGPRIPMRPMGGLPRTPGIPQMGGDDGPSSIRRMINGFEDLTEAAGITDTTFGFISASIASFTGKSNTAREAAEAFDDDMKELGESFAEMLPVIENVSANIGPFNVSLTNLMITIPTLIGTVGPLIALLAGLAGAALAAASAFGALIAVGAIEFAQQLEDNFAGIEDTSDALMAIMKGLQKSIVDALAPLQDITIGGIGPMGLFLTVLQDGVNFINLFAKAMAELLEMDVVQTFLLEMRAALLGFSDATEGGMSMIDGLKAMMSGALPILQGFLIWLIDVLPEFMAFVGSITNQAGPAIASFLQGVLSVSVALTKLGASIMEIVLPSLNLLFAAITVLIEVLNGVETALGSVSSVILLTIIVFTTLIFVTVKLAAGLNAMLETLHILENVMDTLVDKVDGVSSATELYTKKIKNNNSALATNIKYITIMAARTLLVVTGIILILDAIGLLNPALELLSSTIGPIVTGFNDTISALEGMGKVGNLTASIIEFLVGVLFILIGTSHLTGLSLQSLSINLNTASISASSFSASTFLASAATYALAGALAFISGLLIVFGVGLASGAMELENMGAAGQKVHDVLEGVSEAIGVSTEFLESLLGAVITITGAMIAFGVIAYAVIGSVTTALVASGWGALIVGFGLSIAFLIDKLGLLRGVAIGVIAAITAALVASGYGNIILAIGFALAALIAYWDELGAAVGWVVDQFKKAYNWMKKLLGMGGATVEASTKMTQEAEPNTSPYYNGYASGYSNQTQNNTNVEVNIDNRGNGEMDEREKQRYGAVVAKHQQKDRQKQDGR